MSLPENGLLFIFSIICLSSILIVIAALDLHVMMAFFIDIDAGVVWLSLHGSHLVTILAGGDGLMIGHSLFSHGSLSYNEGR